MKKKVLLLLCSVFLVFGLIACGNKEKTDKNKDNDTNTKTESTTDKKNDEETIVFTNENADAIVEKNKIEVIGKFVSSKEVTEDDDYNTVEEDENGNIKYMDYTWSYEMKNGKIYGEVSNGGIDTETKNTTIYVLEKDLYEDYVEFEISQLIQEMESESSGDNNSNAENFE